MSMIHRDDAKPVGLDYPLMVVPGYDAGISFTANLITNNATTPVTVKSSTSGKKIYITDVVISSNAAVLAYLEDGAGTSFVPLRLGANAPIIIRYATPTPVTESLDLMLRSATATSIAIQVNGYVK